ncbi:hypothetical protein HNP84_000440 [Thermocatellispora tengchongensis]|uniref:GerMN domain-containing protein n=1 Tax=Thermocatellispora tengchongensis TaxID=1073253 RepID=A0A840NU19_9ACTN|nr:hypothetical protein [Thermocatellispora tengchongensis]MBB5130752.1 hypothetical protein [Thermocatellispora tengchongensis]
MKRICAVLAVPAVLLLAGCGIQPSGVTGGGQAPAGVAPGVTLYFIDAHSRLQPQFRQTGRLGSISEALALLLTGPGYSGLRTGIAPTTVTRVGVATTPGVTEIHVPFTANEMTSLGIDQIVCTALGVHVQSGGSRSMKVRIIFTQSTPESNKLRTCPLIR